MGAEISTISSYQTGQLVSIGSELKVSMASAINIHDSKKYTIFQYEKENGKLPENVNKHLESLKTIRHPYILKYVTSFNSSRHQATLVTEHVVPLDVAVEKQEPEEIFAGLHSILEALIFLHDKALLCHNKIIVPSVFVTDDGTWKLGAFESSTKVLRLSKHSFENDIKGYKEFCLSVLDYLKDDALTTKNFIDRLEIDFSDDNKEMTEFLKNLLNDPFFKFPFLKQYIDLQNIALKCSAERETFYSTLAHQLRSFPAHAVSHRFMPLLFSHFILTDPSADKDFLKHLFCADELKATNANPIYGRDNFIKYSLPFIMVLFESRDAAVRLILLKYFSLYCFAIEKDILRDVVLPELLVGLKDSNDGIVAATFHALAELVPLLGGQTVVGGQFNEYFHDMKPDFTRIDSSSVFSMGNSLENGQKSSISIIRTPDVSIEEKKQHRFEREKQRENQRQNREEHRKLRQESCSIQIIKSTKVEIEQGKDEFANANHSDPDWEGFEAFSSSGSDAREEDADNSWGWDVGEKKKNSKSSSMENHFNATIQNSKLFEVSNQSEQQSLELDLFLPTQKDSFHSQNDISLCYDSQTVDLKTELKVTSFKENAAMTNNVIKEKNTKKDLGSEFDIQVVKRVAEPDYFVDMMPRFKNESIKTVIIDVNPLSTVSSKFAVAEVSQDEVVAWDDNGWGSD